VTPTQCRMARASKLWRLRDLSEKSGVSVATITRFEADDGQKRKTNRSNVAALQRAFEESGVVFVDDGDGLIGVKLNEYKKINFIENKKDEMVHGYYPFPRYIDLFK